MSKIKNRLIFRGIAAGVLWLLLITVTAIAIKGVIIIERTGAIVATAMTIPAEQEKTKMRELAKIFAVEWGTWGCPENYSERMKRFLDRPPPQPNAVQKVNFANVELEELDKGYKATVLLSVTTLVPKETGHPNLIAVTRQDIIRGFNPEDPVSVWEEQLLNIQFLIKTDAQPVIASWPIIINPEVQKGEVERNNLHETPTEELRVFVSQFLTMYYTGEPLTNFVVPDVQIKSLEGWDLKEITEISSNTNQTEVYVEVVVARPGIEALYQRLNLELEKTKSGFLVKKIKN